MVTVPRAPCSKYMSTSCAKVTSVLYDYQHSEPHRAHETDGETTSTCFCVRVPGVGPLVLTNAHCVEQAPRGEVSVVLEHLGRQPMRARVSLFCPELDVAVLEPEDPSLLEPLEMDLACKPGTEVVALGFPLDSDQLRMSYGVTTGTHEHYVQLGSCSINSGNSGGPILNRKTGRVVAIAAATLADSEGISLGIPMRFAARAVNMTSQRLLRVPRLYSATCVPCTVAHAQHLGLSLDHGARVLHATRSARRAGLKADDVITRCESWPVNALGKVQTPHAPVVGVALESVELALEVAQPRVKVEVHRKGIQGPLHFELPLKLHAHPDNLYPLWEPAGGIHYVRVGDIIFVPLSLDLLDEFEAGYEQRAFVEAANAKPGAVVVAWVKPQSTADQAGVQALQILKTFKGTAVKRIDDLAALVPTCHARKRRKMSALTMSFSNRLNVVLPDTGAEYIVKRYQG